MEDWKDPSEMTQTEQRKRYRPVLSGEYGLLRGLGYYLWPGAHETLIEQPQRLARKVRGQLADIYQNYSQEISLTSLGLTAGLLVGGIWFEEYRVATLAAVSAGLTGYLLGRTEERPGK